MSNNVKELCYTFLSSSTSEPREGKMQRQAFVSYKLESKETLPVWKGQPSIFTHGKLYNFQWWIIVPVWLPPWNARPQTRSKALGRDLEACKGREDTVLAEIWKPARVERTRSLMMLTFCVFQKNLAWGLSLLSRHFTIRSGWGTRAI